MLAVGCWPKPAPAAEFNHHPTSDIQHPSLNIRILRRLLARFQFHVSLFPVRTVPGELAAPPQLALQVHGPDLGHLHLEQLLHRLADLRLVGRFSHFKTERVLAFLLADSLFGHDRPADHFMNRHKESASDNFDAAACDSSTLSCLSSS